MRDHSQLISSLKKAITGEVLSDELSLNAYSTDASMYQIKPDVICIPKTETDVIEIVNLARIHNTPICPRGGATSLAGQTVNKGICIDFSKYLTEIKEINPREKYAIVQPGINRDELNAACKKFNLHFAPDPSTSSRANVGGMIANNTSGTRSVLYGLTLDHVLELKLLLSDGTILELKEERMGDLNKKAEQSDKEGDIYRRFINLIESNKEEIANAYPNTLRKAQGYPLDAFIGIEKWNLAKLICGSEGTLGLILEAKISLVENPVSRAVCVSHYNDLFEAVRQIDPVLQYNPSAIELLDKPVLDRSRENIDTKKATHFLKGDPAALLLVEFLGSSEGEALEKAKAFAEKMEANKNGYAWVVYPEGPLLDDVFTVRKKGLGLILGVKGHKKPQAFIEDAAIPTNVLADYLQELQKMVTSYETELILYGHASVGVIHCRPVLSFRDEDGLKKFRSILDQTFHLVKKYKGSWSSEHGDGIVRGHYLKEYFGERVYGLLVEVKELFDPLYLMNPNKIIDVPEPDTQLRYGADFKEKMVDSVFHFRKEESFNEVVHMCNGVGACRKLGAGTMCPSFQASRDEVHTTRARANTLRMAISGQLSEDSDMGLNYNQVYESLDLCLSCKACKSECPSNVDVAKLKSEVWQEKYDKRGIPLRDRLVRENQNVLPIMSGGLAGFFNFVQKTPFFRWTMDKIVGIDQRRVLPEYSSQTFDTWLSKYHSSSKTSSKVGLFVDTYINYHEPNIGIAAYKLLENCGYSVVPISVGCCQRPRISQGFLRDAKKDGTSLSEKLRPYLEEGMSIVVCEPSCTSALQDDLPDLIEDEGLAKKMQEQIKMIDVFLSDEKAAGNAKIQLELKDQSILHGHCHQKALYGTESMKNLLGNTLEEIPSGCCGMAGSFGYEKEHFDISKKIADLVLLPAIEDNPDKKIVACGVSCRHQIKDFSNRKALHWVEAVLVKES